MTDIAFFAKCWRPDLPKDFMHGGRLRLPQTLKKLGRPQPSPGVAVLFWFHGEGLIGETRLLDVHSSADDPELDVTVSPFTMYAEPILGDAWLRRGDHPEETGDFCAKIRANTTSIGWCLDQADLLELDTARRDVEI